jgi:hypothetical protein
VLKVILLLFIKKSGNASSPGSESEKDAGRPDVLFLSSSGHGRQPVLFLEDLPFFADDLRIRVFFHKSGDLLHDAVSHGRMRGYGRHPDHDDLMGILPVNLRRAGVFCTLGG